MDWAKLTAKRDEKYLSSGIVCVLYSRFDDQDIIIFKY